MLLYIPRRYVFALLGHFGFFVIFVLRVNLSVALVAMINSTRSDESTMGSECGLVKNQSMAEAKQKIGEFNWNENQEGLILSSFFYGYLFTQIPGGILASKFGGKNLFGIGVLWTSIFTLLTPVAARTNFYLLVFVRVLEGFGEGVTFPAMHAMVAVWSAAVELTTMSAFVYAGIYTGTIFALAVSGVLAASNFLGGWPSVFYVFGSFGFIWFFLWTIFVTNSPEEHPSISSKERMHILKDRTERLQSIKIPWLMMMRSVPVWSCILAAFCTNWVFFMVITGLPTYFQDVLQFKLTENGFLSALPFLAAFIVSLVAGVTADVLRQKYLSTTNTRKLMTFLGCYLTGVFLILASYTRCDQIALSVTYMTLATGSLIITTAGYVVTIIDMTQNFSGIIMGICNFTATISGCITPSVTGYFTNNHPTRVQYRKVFALAAGLCSLGGLLFVLASNSEKQPWDIISNHYMESSEAITKTSSIYIDDSSGEASDDEASDNSDDQSSLIRENK